MDSLPILLLIFVLGLTTLVIASDFFTKVVQKFGFAIGLPAFLVGVTFVSIGTYLPELTASLFGIFQGAPEIVVGNVIGVNIATTCLGLGITSIKEPRILRVRFDLLNVDLPFFIGAVLLLALMTLDSVITRGESVILVIGAIVYLFYAFRSIDKSSLDEFYDNRTTVITVVKDRFPDLSNSLTSIPHKAYRQFSILIFSGILLYLGGEYTVSSLIQISARFNINEDVISTSAVALGTSVPLLLSSVNATVSDDAQITIGEIIGSNIFNIFVVVGISGLITPLPLSQRLLSISVPMLVLTSLLLIFIVQDNKITTWEGWLYIMLYIWFLGAILGLL